MPSTRRAPAVAAEIEKAAQRHSGRHPLTKHRQRQKIVATQQNILQESNSARMKRPLEDINSNLDTFKPKRTRIAVEIVARPISPSKSSLVVKPQRVAKSTSNPNPPLLPPPPVATAQPPPSAQTAPNSNKATTTHKDVTKHQNKVINGIKHELDRLQPSAADASEAKVQEGRKLRSQEATRFKSELSAYFPDYDEVIGNDPKEHHSKPRQSSNARHPPQSTQHLRVATDDGHHPYLHLDSSSTNDQYPIRTFGDELFTDLFDSQRIDFGFLEARNNGEKFNDPLPDSHFEAAHKKAERLEKSIRNTEKGRAQHEKDQIIRLLNELQGPDWLRTMGVNGVTESRKKTFEPAREHFIKGCQTILEKFRTWSQEEKRRKLEKERALAEAEEEEEEDEEEIDADDSAEDELEDYASNEGDEDEDMLDTESADEDAVSDGDPPDYSDVDASIGRQLHEEAVARNSKGANSQIPPEQPAPREFKSFFKKAHERETALNTRRRRGRTVMAWGHNIPEAYEQNFDLPEEYRDEETMKIRERRKRRDRRGNRR